MTRHAFLAALLLATAAPVSFAETNTSTMTWHGTDGAVVSTGSLWRIGTENITIAQTGSATQSIPLNSLSAADRAYIIAHDDKSSEFQNQFHKWTSANGKYQVDAKAITVDDTSVKLTRADAKVINVPLNKISKDDRSYIDRLQKLLKSQDEDNPFAPADDGFNSIAAFNGDSQTPKAADKKTTTSTPRRTTVLKPKADSGTVDRNPYGETVTGQTATGIPTYTGPRGGTYHYSKSGNKVYSRHK
jgi:hypothetical protein